MPTAQLRGPVAHAAGPRTRLHVIQAADRVLAAVDRVVLAACSALLATLVGVVIVSVVFRYVLNSSLVWGEELARYLAIWVVFLGLSAAHRRGEHVSVGSMLRFLPFVRTRRARRIAELVTFLLCALVTWAGAEATWFNFQNHQTSPALQIPIAWAYLAIPVGFLLMTLQSLNRLVAPEPDTTEEG